MAGLREILGAVPMIGGALASAIPGVGAVAGPLLGAAGSAIFNAAAVERERAWSEKMYNKYNSPQALVRQYQEAGINPALMFGQSAIPAPTTSTAAQAPENPFGDVVGMLGALMNLDLLGEQKRSLKLDNDIKALYGPSTAAETLNKIHEEVSNLIEQGNLTRFQYQVLYPALKASYSASAREGDARAFEQEWRNQFYREHHYWPSEKTTSYFWNLITKLVQDSGDIEKEYPGLQPPPAGFSYP